MYLKKKLIKKSWVIFLNPFHKNNPVFYFYTKISTFCYRKKLSLLLQIDWLNMTQGASCSAIVYMNPYCFVQCRKYWMYNKNRLILLKTHIQLITIFLVNFFGISSFHSDFEKQYKNLFFLFVF